MTLIAIIAKIMVLVLVIIVAAVRVIIKEIVL